ncbi:MAG: tetratricopeptide repeat protein [Bryobacteraceae bacterium]
MGWLVSLLIANTAYVAALPSATIFYVGNVLLHLGLGIAVVVWLYRRDGRSLKFLPLALAALLGIYLIFTGAVLSNRWVVALHIALGVIGLAILFPRSRIALAVLTVVAAGLRFGLPAQRIQNPSVVPVTMAQEGAGPSSRFWPSSAQTNTGGLIPSDFFMESKVCGECHKDIYEQWKSSMHHFASFNNPFYRQTILHMQELSGTHGSRWCSGCHDHAVFFNGRFDRPIKEQLDTPEAQNGLGCVSCHSIVHVDGTMGNGGFTIMYPPLHRLASSQNPVLRDLDRFITYLNPAPHRRTFMRPFMKQQPSEFCSACHKVHLDVPVNHYRWIRGFNEYDNWQASGISGQGARSFYYPPKSSTCTDCHMPLVHSADPGNHGGVIHSHRFATANTAVAFVNKDAEQLRETEKFLQSGFITVDLFAASPAEQRHGETEMQRRSTDAIAAASTFAVGEEAEMSGPVTLREVGKVMAPLNAPNVRFQPGQTVRVDAVVRTRTIGHFFPGGTIDAFDVWLDVRACDAGGRVLFESGGLESDGSVDKGAHFYRAYLLDGAGNLIDKRNAWQARSVLYVRLIPPGAADVAHYLIRIPRDAVGPVTIEAKLNYRKFMESYAKFAFAGVAGPGPSGVAFDSRKYTYNDKPVPVLPVVTLAKAATTVQLGDPMWEPIVRKQDRERWNDWGIGLLLQGDLKGAEYAFQQVIKAEPGYVDGWVNIARALILEGETENARPYLKKALALKPKLARAEFFLAMVRKAAGQYDQALASLDDCHAQYPRDRVVLNQIGRIQFLQRKYADAVKSLQQTLLIDPEDVEAHYNLMLAYRGLGQIDNAKLQERLFQRFKADESSQSLTAEPRRLSAENNNERQRIHDHVSQSLNRAIGGVQ